LKTVSTIEAFKMPCSATKATPVEDVQGDNRWMDMVSEKRIDFSAYFVTDGRRGSGIGS
jgi:hypothetical protein